jgi:hypothetical protein
MIQTALTHVSNAVAPLAVLLLIPLLSFSDREVGDGSQGLVSRSAAMGLAIVLGGALGALTIAPAFFLIGAIWAAHRSIGFFHNSLAPYTTSDIGYTALRYALPIPAVALLAYWSPAHNPLWAAITFSAQATTVVAMRTIFGRAVHKARTSSPPYQLSHDYNAWIEMATGALFGAAVAAYALIVAPTAMA